MDPPPAATPPWGKGYSLDSILCLVVQIQELDLILIIFKCLLCMYNVNLGKYLCCLEKGISVDIFNYISYYCITRF